MPFELSKVYTTDGGKGAHFQSGVFELWNFWMCCITQVFLWLTPILVLSLQYSP